MKASRRATAEKSTSKSEQCEVNVDFFFDYEDDFWLFPKLKKPLKGQRFDDKTTVKNNAMSVLKAIPKSEFQDCFEKWERRWKRVIQ